ncbi:hypothetical protein AB1339_37230, partial [Streptomyces cyaneofuscatus]
VAEPAAAPVEPAAPAAEAPRGRTRRRASAPAGTPQAATATDAAEPAVEPVPAAAEVAAPTEETPAPRSRRRASRKATA